MEEDLEIVRRVQNGEEEAFNVIIDKYYRSVLNLVYRFYGCEAQDAEDITQEIFLRIFRSINKFEGRSSFFTYLYKVTINLCFKKRKLRRITKSLEEIQEHSNDDLVESIRKGELEKMVKEAVSSLPSDQRIVVILNKYEGLSYEEIAKILNISLPAVKSRLHRAKLLLKKKLSPLFADY